MILFENVPAITTKTVEKGSKTLIVDVLKNELKEAGYVNYKEFVLSADQFGVPQKRKRYFILACKNLEWILDEPQPDTEKVVTVEEAFAGLPNVIPNSNEEAGFYDGTESLYSKRMKDLKFWKREEFNNQLTYQKPMKHRECTLERFGLLNQGESLKDLFERFNGEERKELQARRVLPKKMFIKRNYRLVSDQPSPTVTSHCLDEFVHPIYNRALTVREWARLQSFPDSYDFCGGPYLTPHLHNDIQDKYEQIGDAVPPLLAYAWGKCINNILKQYTEK